MQRAITSVALVAAALSVAGSVWAQAPTYLDPTQLYLGQPGQSTTFGAPPGRGVAQATPEAVVTPPINWLIIPLYHASPETLAYALGADNVIYDNGGGGGYGGGGYGGAGVTQGYGGQSQGMGRRARGGSQYGGGGGYDGSQYGGYGRSGYGY